MHPPDALLDRRLRPHRRPPGRRAHSRNGSIDWLCPPRFESGACFAALLGTPDHGRWLLGPSGDARRIRRRYRPDTLVLETDFETATGAVRLIDFMPPRTDTPM
jgi:GH15 family glucan-1,4-alpha-glucosidase